MVVNKQHHKFYDVFGSTNLKLVNFWLITCNLMVLMEYNKNPREPFFQIVNIWIYGFVEYIKIIQ